MKLFRYFSIIAALALMVGEAYRTWGTGRPWPYWMDDMLAGAIMITAAILVAKPTIARRAYFTGAWGVAMGMLYGSFFGKVYSPETSTPGNFSIDVLTWLVGMAFALSIAGFVASIVLPNEENAE